MVPLPRLCALWGCLLTVGTVSKTACHLRLISPNVCYLDDQNEAPQKGEASKPLNMDMKLCLPDF